MSIARGRDAVAFVFLLVGIAASILASSPSTATAQSDDCTGRNQPFCKSIKSCVSVNGSPFTCTTDFYYYPDAT